jgi:hypothetical protein
LQQNNSRYSEVNRQGEEGIQNACCAGEEGQGKEENEQASGEHIAHIENAIYATHDFVGDVLKKVGKP